tara:strand:- start:2153 stop:2368 length:216 start_codon:yes stop_codon:yes gene_type:complete
MSGDVATPVSPIAELLESGEIKRKGTAVIIGLLAVSWPDKMEEEPCENKWNGPKEKKVNIVNKFMINNFIL